MPWITNKNGDKEYIVSKYAKEELPTWAEMHDDFWLQEIFAYNNSENDKNDLYWKIPHRKFILSICCNQLNKMIYEDEFDYSELQKHFLDKIERIQFSLINHEIKNDFPEIYTIPMPSGEENPFILNNHERINVKEIDMLSLKLIIRFDKGNDMVINQNSEKFKTFLEIFMKQYIEYFKEPIGWKNN